jgi:hypothetical protein
VETCQPDPNFNLNGIKWEAGDGFESGVFSVTLSGNLTTGTVHVGAKGPEVAIGQIAGPVCALPTTGTPTITMTGTITPLVTMTTTITPTIEIIPSATALVPPGEGGKVLVCHKPGKNQHTLSISVSALPAHLGHGEDRVGPCP